jgi:hypothetical protein
MAQFRMFEMESIRWAFRPSCHKHQQGSSKAARIISSTTFSRKTRAFLDSCDDGDKVQKNLVLLRLGVRFLRISIRVLGEASLAAFGSDITTYL